MVLEADASSYIVPPLRGYKKRKEQPPRSLLLPIEICFSKTQFISIFAELPTDLLFIGEDGVRVFSIALPSVDFGVGIFVGPV